MVQNNPQYMLARSPTSVPVFVVYNAPHPGSAPSIYGKTRLETCVQAINRSRCGVCANTRSSHGAQTLAITVPSSSQRMRRITLSILWILWRLNRVDLPSTMHPRAMPCSPNLRESLLVWASCRPCLTHLRRTYGSLERFLPARMAPNPWKSCLP